MGESPSGNLEYVLFAPVPRLDEFILDSVTDPATGTVQREMLSALRSACSTLVYNLAKREFSFAYAHAGDPSDMRHVHIRPSDKEELFIRVREERGRNRDGVDVTVDHLPERFDIELTLNLADIITLPNDIKMSSDAQMMEVHDALKGAGYREIDVLRRRYEFELAELDSLSRRK